MGQQGPRGRGDGYQGRLQRAWTLLQTLGSEPATNSRTQDLMKTPVCLDVGLPVDGLPEILDAILKKIACLDVS